MNKYFRILPIIIGAVMALWAINRELWFDEALTLLNFVLPLELEVRQALVILAFSPIGSAVPPFTAELGGDVGLSSAINSMAIVISICIYVVLLGVML